MIGKNLLSSLCKLGIFICLIGGGSSLEAMTRKEKHEVRELLRFMATHRAVTLALRFGDLLECADKTLHLHPVELTCFILTDEESFRHICRINRNFFKQQFLLREWSSLFDNNQTFLDFDEVEEDVENARLNQELIRECLDTNNFSRLLKVLFDRITAMG